MEGESRVVNIDFELWKRAEILAIDKGMSVTEFIEEAIKEKIDREKAQIQV
jgi:macrodomain Ter protein organizer (MatP/YcbG family)